MSDSFWLVQVEGSMLTVRTRGESPADVLGEAVCYEMYGVQFVQLLDEPDDTMVPAKVLLRVSAIASIEPERRESKPE